MTDHPKTQAPSVPPAVRQRVEDELWEAIDDAGIRGRLFRDDVTWVVGKVLESLCSTRASDLSRDHLTRMHHDFHHPRTCVGGGCAGVDEVDVEFAGTVLTTETKGASDV